MIQPFGPHARGRDPLELAIEELHQLGYGIGLKSSWRQSSPSLIRPEKKFKATIQSAGPLSHYRVNTLYACGDAHLNDRIPSEGRYTMNNVKNISINQGSHVIGCAREGVYDAWRQILSIQAIAWQVNPLKL